MTKFGAILLIHILAATIWIGGHLALASTVLPKALKEKNILHLSLFESGYEKIGIPALLIQILTGLWLAQIFVSDFSQWMNFDNPISRLIDANLFLLLATAALAADARLKVMPKLSEKNLADLAWHIISVTIISVLAVVVGVSNQVGWFS